MTSSKMLFKGWHCTASEMHWRDKTGVHGDSRRVEFREHEKQKLCQKARANALQNARIFISSLYIILHSIRYAAAVISSAPLSPPPRLHYFVRARRRRRFRVDERR